MAALKNGTVANAPETTIAIDSINAEVQIRQQGPSAMFVCAPKLLDADGKAFVTPHRIAMNAEEQAAFQAECLAALQAVVESGPTATAFYARVYGFHKA